MRKLLVVCALSLFMPVLTGCDMLYPPEKRVCGKVTRLCKLDHTAETQCIEKFPEMSRSVGKERTSQLVSCVADATTCTEAGGCLAGTGLNAMGEVLKDFLKGLRRTVE